MTKHGVVLEDVAAARHFSFPPPRTTTPTAGGGDSFRKLAAQVDLGAAVVGSWLDSMKVSSPRHRLMAPLPGAADAEHDDWMVRTLHTHPHTHTAGRPLGGVGGGETKLRNLTPF